LTSATDILEKKASDPKTYQRDLASGDRLPRIVGGDDADRTRFPYYVALVDANDQFVCGGSLIASDVVLTAAHCRGYEKNDRHVMNLRFCSQSLTHTEI
jgi:secreted trypsin-like serine protease